MKTINFDSLKIKYLRIPELSLALIIVIQLIMNFYSVLLPITVVFTILYGLLIKPLFTAITYLSKLMKISNNFNNDLWYKSSYEVVYLDSSEIKKRVALKKLWGKLIEFKPYQLLEGNLIPVQKSLRIHVYDNNHKYNGIYENDTQTYSVFICNDKNETLLAQEYDIVIYATSNNITITGNLRKLSLKDRKLPYAYKILSKFSKFKNYETILIGDLYAIRCYMENNKII